MESTKHQAPKNKKSRRRSQQRQNPTQRALQLLKLTSLWPRLKKQATLFDYKPEDFMRHCITESLSSAEEKQAIIDRDGPDCDLALLKDPLARVRKILTHPTACLYAQMLVSALDMNATEARDELNRVWQLIRTHPGLTVEAANIRALLDAAKELNDLTNPNLAIGRESDEHYQDNVYYLSSLMERAVQPITYKHQCSSKRPSLATWASCLEDVAELLQHHPLWEREVVLMRTIVTCTKNLVNSKVLQFAKSDQSNAKGNPPDNLSLPAAIYFRDAVDQIQNMPTDDDKIAAFEGLHDLIQHHPGLKQETAGLSAIIKGELSILNSPAISWANAQ